MSFNDHLARNASAASRDFMNKRCTRMELNFPAFLSCAKTKVYVFAIHEKLFVQVTNRFEYLPLMKKARTRNPIHFVNGIVIKIGFQVFLTEPVSRKPFGK